VACIARPNWFSAKSSPRQRRSPTRTSAARSFHPRGKAICFGPTQGLPLRRGGRRVRSGSPFKKRTVDETIRSRVAVRTAGSISRLSAAIIPLMRTRHRHARVGDRFIGKTTSRPRGGSAALARRETHCDEFARRTRRAACTYRGLRFGMVLNRSGRGSVHEGATGRASTRSHGPSRTARF